MKTQTGIAFAPDETPELLDVYHPDDGGKRAAVLMLHGGGWRVGSRADLAPHAEALARRGFTAVVADYRLMPDHPWPAQIRDTRAAIKWIRDNADALGIEPDRIAALGYSAGAHLAALAAGDPDGAAAADNLGRAPLNAVIPLEPVIGMQGGQFELGYSPAWLMFGTERVPLWNVRTASPMTYVRHDFPPSCIFHGAEDVQIPFVASVMMHKALCAVGAVSDLHVISERDVDHTAHSEIRVIAVGQVAECQELPDWIGGVDVEDARGGVTPVDGALRTAGDFDTAHVVQPVG